MVAKQSGRSFGLRTIEEFLFYEAKLLDKREFEKWLTLFTKTAWYWVPISRSQKNPHDTVSIIYDDRKLLETRVRRLQNFNIHAQNPPSCTSRIVGNILIEKIEEIGPQSRYTRYPMNPSRSQRMVTVRIRGYRILFLILADEYN